jgi:hypothetical protein
LYVIKVLTEYCVVFNVKESMHKAEKINPNQNLRKHIILINTKSRETMGCFIGPN